MCVCVKSPLRGSSENFSACFYSWWKFDEIFLPKLCLKNACFFVFFQDGHDLTYWVKKMLGSKISDAFTSLCKYKMILCRVNTLVLQKLSDGWSGFLHRKHNWRNQNSLSFWKITKKPFILWGICNASKLGKKPIVHLTLYQISFRKFQK